MADPGGFRIRTGTTDDFDFFQEMELETTWENLSPEDRSRLTRAQIAEALRETHDLLLARIGNTLFVAETESGERAGLLWFGESRNLVTGEIEGWVYNVSVAPPFRGRGLGAQLMRHAERHAREQGYGQIGLMVAIHNDVARRLYAKSGFVESNIVMRKRLKPPRRR
jgi:ribosomal protein S18 acetylase RimI-like enzyme